MEKLKNEKQNSLNYRYAGKNYILSVKFELISGNFHKGEAFLFLKRNNEEWSSPIESDSIYLDINWMNVYVSDVFDLPKEVREWLVFGGPVPIRQY